MGLFDRFRAQPTAVPTHVPSPDEPRMLALYKYNSCPYCQRVLKAIDRLGIAVEMRDIQQTHIHRSELRDRTGRTTTPCLFIDDQPLFESLDIVAWLEAYHAANP